MWERGDAGMTIKTGVRRALIGIVLPWCVSWGVIGVTAQVGYVRASHRVAAIDARVYGGGSGIDPTDYSAEALAGMVQREGGHFAFMQEEDQRERRNGALLYGFAIPAALALAAGLALWIVSGFRAASRNSSAADVAETVRGAGD
jgi:hypothetical protein